MIHLDIFEKHSKPNQTYTCQLIFVSLALDPQSGNIDTIEGSESGYMESFRGSQSGHINPFSMPVPL